MRLTLRTLLAYLDDRLSSANAREIGRKLKESPFAQDLADRIKTVVRQRRLTTPGRKVKMIDPNLIAEYLDDQLTPELVSLIEKEVLSSDFSLAEVAASHQIIGLLGDPVELDDRLRERLRKQSPYRSAEESTDHEVEQMTEQPLSDPSQEIWKPMARQRAFSPRSPALILAALLAGWLVLLLTDGLFMGGGKEQTTAQTDDRADPHADHEHADHEHPGDEEAAEGNDTAGSGTEQDTEKETSEEPAGTDSADTDSAETTPAPEPEAAESDPDMQNDTDVAAADSADKPAAAAPESEPPQPDSESDSESPTDEETETASDSDEGSEESTDVAVKIPTEPQVFDYIMDDPGRMLLTRDQDRGDWDRAAEVQGDFPDWHDVLTDRVSALSDPFTCDVSPADAGWRATMVAPCLFQFGDGVLPQLRLYDGRCIITRNKLNELDASGGFDLVCGGVAVRCLPSGEDLRLGLQVVPIDAADEPEDGGEEESEEYLPLANDSAVSVFVAAGSLRLEAKEGEPVVLGKGRAVQWTTGHGEAEDVIFSETTVLDAVPDWVHTADGPAIPEVEELKGRLSQEFEKGGAPLDTARQLCSGRNPLLARYGTAVLSVTRSGDQLVQVLLQTDEEQVRIEAIRGIRQAAGQSVVGWKTISRTLENRLPRRDLDDFVTLLRGFTPEEAEDEQTSQWIVSMLNHDRAVIRQLAIMNLYELTGQQHNYHPDSERSARSEAVKRWGRWLRRNQNRLVAPQ